MRGFSIDKNNDIFIATNGRLAVVTDLESCLQACQTAAQAQLGEMVLSIDTGVPNFQTIWRDSRNVAQFEAYVRRAIMAVDNVLEITDFNVSVQDNVVKYEATISTIYGSGVVSNGL